MEPCELRFAVLRSLTVRPCLCPLLVVHADVGNYTVIAMVVDRQTFCLAAPQRKLGAPVEFQSPCQPTSYNMDGYKVFSITSCGRPAKGQLQRYLVSVTGGADDLCLTAGDDGRMVLDLCNCGSDRQAVSFDGAENLFSMGPIGPAVMKFVGSGLMCLQPPSGYRPIEGAKVSFCSPGRGFAASQIYVRTEGECMGTGWRLRSSEVWAREVWEQGGLRCRGEGRCCSWPTGFPGLAGRAL